MAFLTSPEDTPMTPRRNTRAPNGSRIVEWTLYQSDSRTELYVYGLTAVRYGYSPKEVKEIGSHLERLGKAVAKECRYSLRSLDVLDVRFESTSVKGTKYVVERGSKDTRFAGVRMVVELTLTFEAGSYDRADQREAAGEVGKLLKGGLIALTS